MSDEFVPRCPKCRSKNFTAYVQELIESSAPIQNGEITTSWGLSAMPERKALHGRCNCGHEWRFRDRNAL